MASQPTSPDSPTVSPEKSPVQYAAKDLGRYRKRGPMLDLDLLMLRQRDAFKR